MLLNDNSIVTSHGLKSVDSFKGFMKVQVGLEFNVGESDTGICKDASPFVSISVVASVVGGLNVMTLEFLSPRNADKVIDVDKLSRHGFISREDTNSVSDCLLFGSWLRSICLPAKLTRSTFR